MQGRKGNSFAGSHLQGKWESLENLFEVFRP